MRCSRLLLLALPILAPLFASCATEVSSACPPVAVYDPVTLHEAADELAQLVASKPEPALGIMMRDYANMRRQARICGG